IKLDGSGLNRLTNTEGNHRSSFNSSASHFIDSWNDVNTPTQVKLYDAAGKLVRAIDENKVDALKQYKLGKVEFMNVKTRDGFTMRSEEHTSELQSRGHLVCRLQPEKKNKD